MSTHGQFNTKNPTIKRILKEATELSTHATPDYHAAPLDSNLFEWHFTLRGPPSPSPYHAGLYHGRIILPPTYPLRPPSFRFLTPSGRFEPNREICLSISGHHEESWQPAWGIRTALVAIRSFMDSEAKGQVGGIEASGEARRRLAGESGGWKCRGCGGRSNGEIMKEREEEARGAEQVEEKVPDELRLGYRDELGNGKEKEEGEEPCADAAADTPVCQSVADALSSTIPIPVVQNVAQTAPEPSTSAQRQTPALQQQHRLPQAAQQSISSSWIDLAIGGLAVALGVLVLRKLLSIL